MREFVVEADGGSRGNPGPAGYGAVVRDASTGETLAEAAEYLGTATNNVAEYRGLVAGLRAAHALDPDARVSVRMDSKLVVEQMSGRWKIKHPDMKPLAMEAARIFPPGRVTYTWMPRAENKHADRLANEAMDAGARGERWTPSARRGARSDVLAASGPPGDAVAGAARAREALRGGVRGVEAAAGGGAAEMADAAEAAEQRPGVAVVPEAPGAPGSRSSSAADRGAGVADGQLAWAVGAAAARGAGAADGQLAWPVDADPRGTDAVTTTRAADDADARAARTLAGSTSAPADAASEGAVAPTIPEGTPGAEGSVAAAPQGASVSPTGAGIAGAASKGAVVPGGSGPARVGNFDAEATAAASAPPAGTAVAGAGSVGAAAEGAAVQGAFAVPAGSTPAGTGWAGAASEGAVAPTASADDPGAEAAVATGGVSPGGDAADTPASPTADRTSAAATDPRTSDQAAATTAPGWSAAPDLGAPATFVLLRHGETPLTPQKRFSGSGGTDPSLSEVGREQAERVATALARRGTIQAVVASPLARTRETAGIVADRLGLGVTVDDGLRETDFGAWEGLTFGEVRERYPDDLTAWLADPTVRPTGDGESFTETADRIEAARARLVAAHAGRTVLLVTHVTPIKTLLRLALGAPPESLFRMELSAASLSAVAYYRDGNASVRLFNDTSHLRP
ncbi:bifunctional RNase H/acid phosphatase [Streptomyces sp. NPDC004100]